MAQKINEEVKLLTSIGEIMSIGTLKKFMGPKGPILGHMGPPSPIEAYVKLRG